MRLQDCDLRTMRPGVPWNGRLKVFDGHGLYVDLNGRELVFRYAYSFGGGTFTCTLGEYPEISLDEARLMHARMRKGLKGGLDPRGRRARDGRSFGEAVTRWREDTARTCTPGTMRSYDLQSGRLRPLFNTDVSAITRESVLDCIRGMTPYVQRQTVELATRVLERAVSEGLAPFNPLAGMTRSLPRHRTENRAARTDPKTFGELLRIIEEGDCAPLTRQYLRLLPLLMCRPSELAKALWWEFDLHGERPVWRIPAERMKTEREHVVPLSRQAVALLEELRPFTARTGRLFPGKGGGFMNRDTGRRALRAMGVEDHDPHGFRASASTLLHEAGYPPDYIEAALAHTIPGVRGVYARSCYLAERIGLMQAWADMCDAMRERDRPPVYERIVGGKAEPRPVPDLSVREAARISGIARSTLARWARGEGRVPDGFPGLADEVKFRHWVTRRNMDSRYAMAASHPDLDGGCPETD